MNKLNFKSYLFRCYFFGGIGVHKFYIGDTKHGILYFLFSFTSIPLILSRRELIRSLVDGEDEFKKKYNIKD